MQYLRKQKFGPKHLLTRATWFEIHNKYVRKIRYLWVIRGSIYMKVPMKWQEKGDLLLQVTFYYRWPLITGDCRYRFDYLYIFSKAWKEFFFLLLKMPVILDPTHIHPILKNPWWLYFPYTKDFSITLTGHGWRAGNSTLILVFFFSFDICIQIISMFAQNL
jgi:hypothetical protein